MDVLTDILNSAGLRKSLLLRRAFYKPWSMRFPCERSMGFHIITHGSAYINAPKFEEAVKLERGDVILIKRGFEHVIATHPSLEPVDECPTTSSVSEESDVSPLAVIVAGLYQFQTPPIHPLFNELPEWIVIRAGDIPAHSPLYATQQLMSAELSQEGQGSESVVKALVDVMFHYILRDWLTRQVHKQGGEVAHWGQVFKDKALSRAIENIHARPEQEWNLETLAKTSGLSRAAFAQRFKRLAGDTPAHYLARVRIQRAMDLLRSTDDNMEKIAERVGYGDPFVFSKVFKRIQGVSPREFRKTVAQVEA